VKQRAGIEMEFRGQNESTESALDYIENNRKEKV
jgi:hypothetical protein